MSRSDVVYMRMPNGKKVRGRYKKRLNRIVVPLLEKGEFGSYEPLFKFIESTTGKDGGA